MDAVFMGLVLPGGNDLAVLRSWKGDPPPTVRFFVGTDRVLEPGQQYLIYGERMTGGAYAATCGVAAVRYARADIEYLDKVRAGRTPGNSVIVEPWPEKTFRRLRLRSRTRVVELRNVGVGQYYADNIPPGTWLLETGVPGYRLRDPWVVEIKPTSHLRLSPMVIAPPEPH